MVKVQGEDGIMEKKEETMAIHMTEELMGKCHRIYFSFSSFFCFAFEVNLKATVRPLWCPE